MTTGTAAALSPTDHCDRTHLDRVTPLSGDGDDRLVAAVRGGDDRAFELLFQRYRAPIGAYVASLVRDRGDSEDVTQDVFMSALRSLRMSDRPVAFKPWIYEIARNACIDRHRRSRRRDEIPAGTLLETDSSRLIAAPAATESSRETRERFAQLCRTLLELPALDRRLLVMREFEGRSYREIVERSGLSTAAVESALFRARRRLVERSEAQPEPPFHGDAALPPGRLAAERVVRSRLSRLRDDAHAHVAGVSSSS